MSVSRSVEQSCLGELQDQNRILQLAVNAHITTFGPDLLLVERAFGVYARYTWKAVAQP